MYSIRMVSGKEQIEVCGSSISSVETILRIPYHVSVYLESGPCVEHQNTTLNYARTYGGSVQKFLAPPAPLMRHQ